MVPGPGEGLPGHGTGDQLYPDLCIGPVQLNLCVLHVTIWVHVTYDLNKLTVTKPVAHLLHRPRIEQGGPEGVSR